MCNKIGTVVKVQDGKTVAMKLTCKSWGCPDCAPIRRKQLIALAMEGAPTRFITLTCSTRTGSSRNERAALLARTWRDFIREWRRKHPSFTAEYLAVVEAHKSGEPHLHIVFRGNFIPFTVLRDFWIKKLNSHHVNIQAIHNRQKVALYCAKYITKDNIKFGTCKRYWFSQNYLDESRKDRKARLNAGAVFYILDESLEQYITLCKLRGYRVERNRDGTYTIDHPPSDPSPPLCLLSEPLFTA